MESLWKLVYLLEPAPIALILTAIAVSFASAFRALNYGKEMERNRDWSEASITLDRSQALMIPVVSSCSLLMMFYLFSSVSQILTVFTAVASASSLYFCLFPYIAQIKSRFGLADPFVSRCCSKPFTRIQGLLTLLCIGTVIAWLVSGHWILNNLLGISLCIAFVSHVRLPNIKVCAMLLGCLFVYDIFWVFYSERFFGANVMVSVATQQSSNPVHIVANRLSLPGLQLITKKLELPVKIVFPRNLLGGVVPGYAAVDFMMLGLGDMRVRHNTGRFNFSQSDEVFLHSWVAQWFGLETSMLDISSSKPLASKSKGFVFWVELVAPGLPSAGYLSCLVCELLHRSGVFTLCAPKG
ncbi:hypothetical protein KY290_006343 [Solanum tuberosum]|uniref:Signal peptide peptidase-like 1 n=1 Tax=Solanum tuberosum TaxID=4113 RepID=A0ABQ7WGN7_SOLTU|nr:hypothetical protein KY284_006382 [Solanum tuberosum]KAH0723670.1 hypothetical protein KY289_006714 [Solanum tuberosum]KAH0779916.1 hypothetical protein KY290_006343 [Solanum tuberosum]